MIFRVAVVVLVFVEQRVYLRLPQHKYLSRIERDNSLEHTSDVDERLSAPCDGRLVWESLWHISQMLGIVL